MDCAIVFSNGPRFQRIDSQAASVSSLGRALGSILVLGILACSCVTRMEALRQRGQEKATEEGVAEEWIVSRVAENLKEILPERVVHLVADEGVRLYSETWGKETPHVEIFYGDYAVRLPLEEIAGYSWDAARLHLETGEFGPTQLMNGWGVWLGHFERADAVSRDLAISVRDTCTVLSSSGVADRDRAVRRICEAFRRDFVFPDDLELFRRLWCSSFDVATPLELATTHALEVLFLTDSKRLLAPNGALDHVAELSTPWMKGFEFGNESSEDGFSARLFDGRNQLTVLFLRPETADKPLAEEFRRKALASIRPHRRRTPGLEMFRKAEDILASHEVKNAKEVAALVLFSSLQFLDQRVRAARMLAKLVAEGAPEEKELVEMLKSIAASEGAE